MNTERLQKAFNSNHPRTEMSEDEMRIAVNLMLSKDREIHTDVNELDKTSELYKHFEPLIKSLQMQIFLGRLKHLTTLRITLGAFLMIAQYLDSLGSAVMYAYYMHIKLPANTLIGFNEIAMDLFPWGFFSKEQLNSIWHTQKVSKDDNLTGCVCHGSPDNLLDYNETWKK